MALFGLGVMVGPTLGPTLGGWLTDRYSWPWIFYINVPIGIAAAAMVIVYVRDSAHQVKAKTIDYMGVVLLALSVGSLQYLLEHGQREDWFDSPLIVALTAVSVIGGVLLVWRELVIDEPVIDFRILRHREMTVGTIIGIFFGVGLFGSVFVLPIFLQGMLRMTAWQTGMVILPGAIASAVSMAVVGRLTNKVDARLFILTGTTLFFISMLRLSHITGEAGTHDFFWPLIWRGLGLGMMFVPLTNITLADLAPREIAAGAALSNFFRQLGGSLGIAAMATMLTHFTQQARAVLVEHVTAYDPVSIERVSMLTRGFMSRGADAMTARQLALGVIDRQVLGQANVIAFGKVYLLSGAILLGTLPLLLFVRKTRPTGGGAGAVHAE
jgi:DHA2 family multidrug resistance protein